jgi:membrane associated rhomboid family serine protease
LGIEGIVSIIEIFGRRMAKAESFGPEKSRHIPCSKADFDQNSVIRLGWGMRILLRSALRSQAVPQRALGGLLRLGGRLGLALPPLSVDIERMKSTPILYPSHRSRLPWPVAVVLALCILPELILQLADLGVIGPPYLRSLAYRYGAFQPDIFSTHGPLFPMQTLSMFFTYGFLHTGLLHLGVNMIGLAMLGQMVLTQRTSETFLTLYILATIGAAESFALFATGGGTVVGASGAIFGLLGVYVVDNGLLFHSAANHRFWPKLSRVLLMTLLVILSDIGGRLLLGISTAWEAHAGGFLTGALFAVVAPSDH